jgi:tRNA uridine 5-carbamoylmethylation protein Kti12
MTKVINFVGSPGTGKTVAAALTFAELKMRHLKAEYVQEYAKTLVWQKKFEELDNQYQVSTEQYRMIKAVDGAVDYIVCDSGLVNGLFYNKYNDCNVSDIIKTEKMILQKMGEFDNLYIFLERNEEFPYESAGRVQGEKEARTLDLKFKEMLESLNIPYISVLSSKHSIQKILDYII